MSPSFHVCPLVILATCVGASPAQTPPVTNPPPEQVVSPVSPTSSLQDSPTNASSSAPTPSAEADKATTTSTADCSSCGGTGFEWKKVPRVRPFPKIGNFSVLATGAGYYSALDEWRGECLEAPPKYPYPRFGLIQPSFFDADNFAYLDDPKNTECDLFDSLKRIRFGEHWLAVTGGDVRTRYENHDNARLTETSNEFDLTRVRAYADLWYCDDFRLYGEFIGAWSTSQDLAPLPIDRNHADLLNLFVDAKIAEGGGHPAYVRVGRQELLLGSQRLISPLEWANTRRTFQGVRAFRQTEKTDVDLFWVQPVVPNVDRLDSVDDNQQFAGSWLTHRPDKNRTIDAYYLLRDDSNSTARLGIPTGGFTRHTFGGRYVGNNENVLYDVEGALQLGAQNDRTVVAGMGVLGAGYNFKDSPLNPTVWAYYDYASGGGPTAGEANTFNPLFPFGHYYLGWIDQVGRQNIHDLNFHLYLYPTKWITTWLQFHSFWLANDRDALYNAAGLPIRFDPTGRAGSHVGEELDLVVNVHLTKHWDVLGGYSYLWGGEFLRNTRTESAAQNTSMVFLQASYRW